MIHKTRALCAFRSSFVQLLIVRMHLFLLAVLSSPPKPVHHPTSLNLNRNSISGQTVPNTPHSPAVFSPSGHSSIASSVPSSARTSLSTPMSAPASASASTAPSTVVSPANASAAFNFPVQPPLPPDDEIVPPPPLPDDAPTPTAGAKPVIATAAAAAGTTVTITQPPLPTDDDEVAPPPPPVSGGSDGAAAPPTASVSLSPPPLVTQVTSHVVTDAKSTPAPEQNDEEHVMVGLTEYLQSVVIDPATRKLWRDIEKADEAPASAAASAESLLARVTEQHKQLQQSVKMFRHAAFLHRKASAQLALAKGLESKPRAYVASERIVEISRYYLSAGRVALYYVDAAHPDKEKAIWGVEPEDPRYFDEFKCWSGALGASSGLVGAVASSGKSALVADCKLQTGSGGYNMASIDTKTHSTVAQTALCVPVKDADQSVIAILFAVNKTVDNASEPFTEEDQSVLESIASSIRITVHRCRTDLLLSRFVLDETTGQRLQVKDMVAGAHGAHGAANALLTMNDRTGTGADGVGGDRPGFDRQRTMSFQWPSLADNKNFRVGLIKSFSFNVWDHSDNDLFRFTIGIFTDCGLLEEFKIPITTLSNFVLAVRKHYRQNPFHNWKHGFAVLHFTYLTLKESGAANYLLPADVLALVLASLCHDIDHPGNTNSYEVATSSNRALLHNDIHVLENHHASTMFHLMRDERCNVLATLSKETALQLRASMIKAILATDMVLHFDEIKRVQAVEMKPVNITAAAAAAAAAATSTTGAALATPSTAVTAATLVPQFDTASEKDRQFLINILIHSSDLSGQVLPTQIARVWEDRITLEFQAQADAERKLGMTPAPFMQNLNVSKARAKLQVGFIDFVLTPWWTAFTRCFPAMAHCLNRLHTNRKFFYNVSMGTSDVELKLNEYNFNPAPMSHSGSIGSHHPHHQHGSGSHEPHSPLSPGLAAHIAPVASSPTASTGAAAAASGAAPAPGSVVVKRAPSLINTGTGQSSLTAKRAVTIAAPQSAGSQQSHK